MALPPRKTYPELTALTAPVVDSDVLAVYRSPSPLRRTTASVLKTYFQTGAALSATLAASGGAALIGTSSGATVQDALGFNVQSVGSFGALTPAATAATTLATAISTLGRGADLFVKSDLNIGTAYVTNNNVEIHGNPAYYNTADGGGNRPVNYWGRDRLMHFGREQLARLYYLLDTNASVSIGMIGDSNTESYVGPILEALLEGVSGITVTNYGVSSTYEAEWLNETGVFATGQPSASKNFTAVMAANHDLIINGYGGTNDPAFGRTAAQFLTTKRASLAAIRAAKGDPGAVGILQLTANTQNAGASGRDPLFLSQVNAGMRQIVQDPSIAAGFFDKTAELPDPFPDFAVSGFSNKWLDSARVHTQFGHTTIMAQLIFEWLIPGCYRGAGTTAVVTPGTGFTLPASEKMVGTKAGNTVVGGGYIAMTTPAALTLGQTIATLPVGYRPVTRAVAMLALFNGGLPTQWEYNVPVQILSDGTINVGVASVMSPQRAYLVGSWSTVTV